MRYSDADRVTLKTSATVNRFTVLVADDAINSQVIDDFARSFQDVSFHGDSLMPPLGWQGLTESWPVQVLAVRRQC
jgi:hypothetical protein